MDINILLTTLKNGYSYTVNEEGKEPYTVPHPPNRYMLAAAKTIEQMAAQLNNDQVYLNQLQKERDMYYQEIEVLRADIQKLKQEGAKNEQTEAESV